MRNWLVIFVVAAVAVLGSSGEAFSMGQAPKSIQVTGKVAEVNLKALTVKIVPAKGESVTLQINEKTKLTKGERNITPPSIKKDDQITATYKASWGKKIALAIDIREVAVPKKTTPTKSKR